MKEVRRYIVLDDIELGIVLSALDSYKNGFRSNKNIDHEIESIEEIMQKIRDYEKRNAEFVDKNN